MSNRLWVWRGLMVLLLFAVGVQVSFSAYHTLKSMVIPIYIFQPCFSDLAFSFSFLALLKKSHPGKELRLVMAGGYDPRLQENLEHYSELCRCAEEAGLREGEDVEFLRSPSEHRKLELLHRSSALLYTPSGEHFGIVPVEAMYCGLPVVAVADGGPLETVADGATGFLREARPEAFAGAMNVLLKGGEAMKRDMGESGRRRVQQRFSFDTFTEELCRAVAGQPGTEREQEQ